MEETNVQKMEVLRHASQAVAERTGKTVSSLKQQSGNTSSSQETNGSSGHLGRLVVSLVSHTAQTKRTQFLVLTKAEEELLSVALAPALLAAELAAELALLTTELRLSEAELAAPDAELLTPDAVALASLPEVEPEPLAPPAAKMVVAAEVVMVEPSVVMVVSKDEVVMAEPDEPEEPADCD